MTGKGVQALSAAVYSTSYVATIGSDIESFVDYTRASVRLEEGKSVSS